MPHSPRSEQDIRLTVHLKSDISCYRKAQFRTPSRAVAERSRRTGIAQDRVLREIARIAFLDPSDLIDFDTLEIKKDASADDLAALVYYKQRQRPNGDRGVCEEREVRFYDKLKALDMLARHLGMCNQDLAIEDGQYGVVILPAIDETLLEDQNI